MDWRYCSSTEKWGWYLVRCEWIEWERLRNGSGLCFLFLSVRDRAYLALKN
jgi:hypothetical protein